MKEHGSITIEEVERWEGDTLIKLVWLLNETITIDEARKDLMRDRKTNQEGE